MGRFIVGYTGETTSTAARTVIKLVGTSAKCFEMFETGHFGDGRTAPADIQHEISAGFLTNGGVGAGSSAPTPEKMQQSSAVSGITLTITHTTEPTTYTTNVFTLMSFNQRGGMRWAVPIGMGYMADAGDTNLSLGLRCQSSAAGTIGGNAYWSE